jgi:putative transposase
MSRKKKGSNRYKKQCLKVARIHEKIRDQRWWLYHNLTTSLVTNYDLICVESLNVKGMVRNRKLAKSISDASFSTFISMLEYKCAWYGKTFHKVDRWFASSKTCNHCGCKVDALPLNVREWTCPSCGTHLDRDVNAARNILDEGTRDLYGDHASAVSADYRRGEDVRPNQLADEAASMKRLASCFG